MVPSPLTSTFSKSSQRAETMGFKQQSTCNLYTWSQNPNKITEQTSVISSVANILCNNRNLDKIVWKKVRFVSSPYCCQFEPLAWGWKTQTAGELIFLIFFFKVIPCQLQQVRCQPQQVTSTVYSQWHEWRPFVSKSHWQETWSCLC